MSKFKIGDIVQLNSGSPDMIITIISKVIRYETKWTTKNGSVEYGDFPEECLTKKEITDES